MPRRSVSWVDDAKVLSFSDSDADRADASSDRSPRLGSAEAERLMARVREDDVPAFERIVEGYWEGTLLYALQLVGERDLADDLAQEAFARLWQSRTEWRGDGSVRAWLLQTARRLFLSDQRRSDVRTRWLADVEGKLSRRTPTPLQELERNELRAAISEAVKALSPRRREAFTLVHLQGLSNLEVAQIMDVRPQTIANYLQAAFEDLRDHLKPHFPSFGSPPSGSPPRLALDGS